METLDIDFSDSATVDLTPRILSDISGGGMEQRAEDGINTVLQKWNIAFNKRKGDTIDAVYQFLKAQQGYKSFWWTPYGEVSPRRFICPSVNVTFDNYTAVQSLSFSLEEVPL